MQSTREHILNILKERGQATVEELSQDLGLTAVTIRHHIDILRSEGLIAPPLIRRRKTPGRPQYVYTLDEKADSFFPKRYPQLASLILEEVREHLSQHQIKEIMQTIGRRIAQQADIPAGKGFTTRLDATVDFLNEMGYMARWEENNDGYHLHIINCPYEQVSQQDHEICTIDMTMLTHLLGTTPKRITWTAEEDLHCTYFLLPKND